MMYPVSVLLSAYNLISPFILPYPLRFIIPAIELDNEISASFLEPFPEYSQANPPKNCPFGFVIVVVIIAALIFEPFFPLD